MTFSFTLGWWIAPTLLTVSLLFWALYPRQDERNSGGMFGPDFISPAFRLLISAIVSLFAWLCWSLMR